MKNIICILLLLIASLPLFSKEEQIQVKLDSILAEADLLYAYEKAVWNSTDLLMTDTKLKRNYGGYVVSHSGDTVLVTYADRNQKASIARYTYVTNNLNEPYKVNKESSPLTGLEQELFDIKIKILNQIQDSKYEVTLYEGFNPNLVLLKEENEFRLYIIMGTTESGVIPFGNDYLFKTDTSGTITEWKKFHSRMIPLSAEGPNGQKVVTLIHSHLKTTPYITATDICTFRLYADLYEIDEFMVLCTATSKYYGYNRKTNKIEVSEP